MKYTKELRLSFTERALEIVKELSLEEKVSLMGGNVKLETMMESFKDPKNHYNFEPYPAGGLKKYDIPQMLFCDGPRGVVCDNGKTTAFPVSMLRGASFDTDLEKKIGEAIAKEVIAVGGNLFAGICINLPYNPGWGRSQETYGEESFHLGEMGKALVYGVQENGVIACIKHFAFNSMEISRFKVNVQCDIRTEREVFLPHFKECIDAEAASVMSAYNLYKGVNCGHSDYLLNDVLKKEWDFDGFVMSDFGWGIRDTVEAANGGQDMEMCCTEFFGDKLIDAVIEGLVPESKIDEAALRIVRTLISLNETFSQNEKKSVLGCKEHINLALESARKGITLIQNKNKSLPLNNKEISKVLVIGEKATKDITGDRGSSEVHPAYTITALKGLAEVGKEYEVIYYSGENIDHAKTLAQEADATIFVVGYDHSDEGEYITDDQNFADTGTFGGDRTDLGLHKTDIELIKAVAPNAKLSTVVLIGGNMIMMEEWKDSTDSIIMAYYPGMEGGRAIAEIIFGEINPSGKLPYVIPQNSNDLPQVDWDTDNQYYEYYHGYAKLEKEGEKPSIHYGFGLSYTKFLFSNAIFAYKERSIKASCEVKNIGKCSGEEVVQMYVGFKNSSVDRPVKLLRGFKRILLKPGESKTVEITCPEIKLCWYNPETSKMELEKMEYEVYIGNSANNADLLSGRVLI